MITNITLPMKGILVLIVMAVHSQHYAWWLYLLIFIACLQITRKEK